MNNGEFPGMTHRDRVILESLKQKLKAIDEFNTNPTPDNHAAVVYLTNQHEIVKRDAE
jgi:hypothetical protein